MTATLPWWTYVIGGAGVFGSGLVAFLGARLGSRSARDLSFDERFWDKRFELYVEISASCNKMSRAVGTLDYKTFPGVVNEFISYGGRIFLLGTEQSLEAYLQAVVIYDEVSQVLGVRKEDGKFMRSQLENFRPQVVKTLDRLTEAFKSDLSLHY